MENTGRKERKAGRPRMARGLSSLMADLDAKPATSAGAPRVGETTIEIGRISPNPHQPRRTFTDAALDELAASVREKGIIQPLILRKSPRDPDRYEIVAGERRWRAAQRTQLHEVPAIVRDLDDAEVLEIAIVENIQRADLDAMEEAAGYRQLMERFGHTQQALAQALGKSRSHVANLLRLLALPEAVQEMVRSGDLSAGHARALVTAADPEALARRIVAKRLSVRQAETLAQEDRTGKRPPPRDGRRREKDADTRTKERDLAASLGMKVSIDHVADGEAGSVTFRYGTREQFDELCRRLLVTGARRRTIRDAHPFLKDYDGSTMTAVAEMWAEEHLGMVKAEKGREGYDGILPNGRKLQVKSKKFGAHKDSSTYITLSKSTSGLADDLVVVFVDHETCDVKRQIGPVPIDRLSPKDGRVYLPDMEMVASSA